MACRRYIHHPPFNRRWIFPAHRNRESANAAAGFDDHGPRFRGTKDTTGAKQRGVTSLEIILARRHTLDLETAISPGGTSQAGAHPLLGNQLHSGETDGHTFAVDHLTLDRYQWSQRDLDAANGLAGSESGRVAGRWAQIFLRLDFDEVLPSRKIAER